jgi:GT2 family glycosyltransferase
MSESALSKVAVIIVNYNGGEIVLRCLESLKSQTLHPNRILLVDNASQDNSLALIEKTFPEVEIIHSTKNLGFAAANNLAVQKADNCRWVALLNPDAFPEPDWLEILIKTAENNPDFSFFGSTQFKYGTKDILDGTGDVYHVSGQSWRRDFGHSLKNTEKRTGEIFSPCAAAALYKREAFLKVGGFDANYFCQIEDVDLGFRLRLAGYKCLHVPEAIVWHIGSAFSGENSRLKNYFVHRNMVWTYFKNMPGHLFWKYLPQHILANIFILLWLSLKGQPLNILKAKWDAFKRLKLILAERKKIQKNVNLDLNDLLKVMPKRWITPYTKMKRFLVL